MNVAPLRPSLMHAERLITASAVNLVSGTPYVFQFSQATRRGSAFTFAGAANTRVTYVGPKATQCWIGCLVEARRAAGPISGGWGLVVRLNGVEHAGEEQPQYGAGPSPLGGPGSVTVALTMRKVLLRPGNYVEFRVTQWTTATWAVRSLHAYLIETGYGAADPASGA